MYSTHNGGKSVVAERFIRTLKNNIYKYMTSILKNVYIDKLDDIVNKYKNTYHRTIKIKPVDIKSSTYIDFNKENKDLNVLNWSEEVFVIKKVKNIAPWTYVINNLNGEEIVGTFYEKELKKTNQK